VKHKVVTTLSPTGVQQMIDSVQEYREWLKTGCTLLLERLAQEGYEVARAGFSDATYDGTNDVTVSVEDRGKIKAVVAVGGTVLFIEFGTGITYPDNHPEASDLGMVRGMYGNGHGKQTTWGYYGDPGTNGTVAGERAKGTLVLTHGNPANMPMYNAVKELELRLGALVKEVFR
jgi:hypothetical protein